MVSVLPSVSSALASPEVSGQIVRSPLRATAMPQERLPLAMIVTALILLLVPTGRLMAAEPMILPPELKRLSLGGIWTSWLKLVNMLTQQLDGVIELQRNGGTTFTITFTELQYQRRV